MPNQLRSSKWSKVRYRFEHTASVNPLDIVPRTEIARIKHIDPHPLIKVFGVAHEGEAQGRLVGSGATVVKYLRRAIEKVGHLLHLGLPAYLGHSDADPSSRTRVGEIVGSATTDKQGALHTLAAIWIYPEHRDKKLDVASMEADVEMTVEGRKISVDHVEALTGIALADGSKVRPGFPGATLLGAMTAFQDTLTGQGGTATMDKQELIEAVKAEGIKPTDIFTKAELQADETVKSLTQTKHEHARRLEQQLGKEREERAEDSKKADEARNALADKVKELQGQVDTLQVEALSAKNTSLFDEAATARKLSDQEKAYIGKKLSGFKSEAKDETQLREAINTFIDEGKADFKATAELFGVKVESDDAKDQKDAGTSSTDNTDTGEKGTPGLPPETDPAKNDFIPGGAAAQAAGVQ
jgi:hypothetical protein